MSKKLVTGLWELKYSNPKIYTNKAADIIKHIKTGKEYVRGERRLFRADIPKILAEDTGEYEFIYLKSKRRAQMTTEEALREIHISNLLK